MSEQVLVFPSHLLNGITFENGLLADSVLTENVLNNFLLQSFFMDRDKAETDENFRQLIPYAVICQDDKIFCYKRTSKGGEKRLHQLRSIGVGGHCSPPDGEVVNPETFWKCFEREIEEEVGLKGNFGYQVFGLINDTSTEVWRVHCGVLIGVGIAPGIQLTLKDKALGDWGWETPEMLKKFVNDPNTFEGWSEILIKEMF